MYIVDIPKLFNPSTYSKSIDKDKSRQENALIWEKMKDIYLPNLNKNRERLSELLPVSELFTTHPHVSVVICAAGPSLLDNIENVRKHREEGKTIIAVDKAYNILKENNIKPDYTITCDWNDFTVNMLTKLEQDDKIIVNLLQHPCVIDKCLELCSNVYAYLPLQAFCKWNRNTYYKDKELEPYFGLIPHSTVTSVAICLGVFIGADNIATIGNELSWKTIDDMPDVYKEMGILKIDRVDGSVRYTVPTFLRSAFGLSFWPDQFKKVKFIDCSNGIVQGWMQCFSL